MVHGKEPAHFLAMFGGKLVIYEGGRVGQASDDVLNDTCLIQVRGTSQLNCKAEQVPLTAESLNSNDCFVLFTKGGAAYIWAGKVGINSSSLSSLSEFLWSMWFSGLGVGLEIERLPVQTPASCTIVNPSHVDFLPLTREERW